METLRRDAARTRSRIVDAARALVSDGGLPGLNAVARAADVGVGTVYRHFATVAELEEAMVWERFDALGEILSGAGSNQLERVLSAHFALLVEDPLFEKVTARPVPALEHTSLLRESLIERLGQVMAGAVDAGQLRPDIEAPDVLLLLCGVAYSARTAQAAADSPRGEFLLRVVLDGLRVVG